MSQFIYVKAFNASGPVTGDATNITGRIAIDNAAFADLDDATATHVGNGVYQFTLSTAEQTATAAVFDFASTTSGVSVLRIPAINATGSSGGGSGTTSINIASTASRQITWPTASETITGTIQWTGQASKAITGAVTFRETIDGIHFYNWAYNAADRPTVAASGVIVLTDGTVTLVYPVTFMDASVGNASGSGARRVVISVVDDSAAAVVGAKVTIQTAAGATIAGRFGNTIAGGVVIFNLDDGDYKGLVTTSGGYAAHTAQAFTVDQDDEPVTLTVTAVEITGADDPSLCAVTVWVKNQHGIGIPNVRVTAELDDPISFTTASTLININNPKKTSDDGSVTFLLVRSSLITEGNGLYAFTVLYKSIEHKFTYRVPDAASANAIRTIA